MAQYTVTLNVNPIWVRMARSPIYFIAVALMGVSLTFAPLFLYWSGQSAFFPGFEWLIVPLCFIVIYCVPGFFLVFGVATVESLRRAPAGNESAA